MVDAGQRHLVVLTSHGELLTFGVDPGGRPLRDSLPLDPSWGHVESISAGDNHTVALTDTGVVLAWGANSHGQLGTGDTANRQAPCRCGSRSWARTRHGAQSRAAIRWSLVPVSTRCTPGGTAGSGKTATAPPPTRRARSRSHPGRGDGDRHPHRPLPLPRPHRPAPLNPTRQRIAETNQPLRSAASTTCHRRVTDPR